MSSESERAVRKIIHEIITRLSDGTESEYGSQKHIDDYDKIIDELQNIKISLRKGPNRLKWRKEGHRIQQAIGAIRFLKNAARRDGIKNGLLAEAIGEQMNNTLGVYGGGFKPFTTGHFAKLADAIRDNTHVILFYGMQQPEPVKMGKRGKPLKSQQKFRSIGATERVYGEAEAKAIFDEYKKGLDRIPNVEVRLIKSQEKDEHGNLAAIRAPVTAIFKTLEDFISGDLIDSNGNQYDKVTVYGDKSAMMPYMRSTAFRDFVNAGKIQFGGAVPLSPDDYVEKLDDLMMRGEEEARDALKSYYSSTGNGDIEELSDEEINDLQSVRGTSVRDLASSPETSDMARRYLPPFLNSEEKDAIINILLTGEIPGGVAESKLDEQRLSSIIKGIIRG